MATQFTGTQQQQGTAVQGTGPAPVTTGVTPPTPAQSQQTMAELELI